MAEDPDGPFNDGFDAWQPKSGSERRNWGLSQPTHFHPFWRWLNWILLALASALVVLSAIRSNYWALSLAILWVLGSISYLVGDVMGRRQNHRSQVPPRLV